MPAPPPLPSSTLAYRPEIDGLRALAVVPVALFHAQVSGFGGGFIGVDVFFVISGYLITAILLRDAVRPGALAAFYERRARRILPALLPVLAMTCAGAWWLFTPDDFGSYAQALAATALFASNILFALRSDYFIRDEGFAPLIHGWSLSVEEQFYLLFPLLLIGLVRYRRGWVLPAVLTMLGASFAMALVLTVITPRPAFYLLPTRAWELMAGAACAVLPAPTRPRGWAGLLGLALIAAGFALIDRQTPAPGPLFAVPIAGAALTLRYATSRTVAGKCLAWRPLVLLGLVSYGFYLWHQALLAMVRYAVFAPGPLILTAALGPALLLAIGSYHWIERPVRSGKALANRRALVAVCAGGLAVAVAFGLAGYGKLIEPRGAEPARRLNAVYAGPQSETPIVPAAPDLTFVLYGDSHARQYYPALVEQLGQGAILAGSACFAAPRVTNLPPGDARRADCIAQFAQLRSLASTRRIGAVIWAQRWERPLFANSDGRLLGATVGADAPLLRDNVARLRAALPADVALVLVGNVPTAAAAGHAMRDGLLRCRAYLNVACPTDYPQERAEAAANAVLRAYAAATPGVTYVDAAAPLCPDSRCRIIDRGVLLYSDGSHLTPAGARRIAGPIARAVAMRAPPP